jgi:hypothetical protein
VFGGGGVEFNSAPLEMIIIYARILDFFGHQSIAFAMIIGSKTILVYSIICIHYQTHSDCTQ